MFQGYGHGTTVKVPPNIQPFTTKQFAWPLNLGIQQPHWQAGGPSGFQNGTAGAIKPWPYMTGFKNFISAYPYGVASTLVRNQISPNLGAGALNFVPLGMVKMPTYANRSY